MVKFVAKPWRTGNAYVITIPKAFIDNIIDPTTECEIVISQGEIDASKSE